GLAIVKQILTLFNSSIHLESSPGNGACFSFTIPFEIQAEIANITQAKAQEEKTDLSHLKILVAEDNEINRMIIKKQFDNIGIKPLIVENGQLAYDALLAADFDAIFMDLHMPVMDGYETTRKIRLLKDVKKAKTHIIAFTASVTEQQQIAETGFDD